jgi:hypothetical protein
MHFLSGVQMSRYGLIHFFFLKKKVTDKLQVIVAPEPLYLGAGIAVDDITFFILKIPGDHNKDISFPDPDFLFDLSLDPSHPCHAVITADADMVCTHHQFSAPEHLTVSFLWQFYPDDLVTRWCSRFLVCQYNLSCVISIFLLFYVLNFSVRENIIIPKTGIGVQIAFLWIICRYYGTGPVIPGRNSTRSITAPKQQIIRPDIWLISLRLPALIRERTDPSELQSRTHHAAEPQKTPVTNSVTKEGVSLPRTTPNPGKMATKKMIVSGFASVMASMER